MTYELRSISPTRLSRVMAWVVGGIFLIICLIMIPMFLLTPFPEHEGQPSKSLFLVFLVLYPVFGAIWGWICGQLTARLYNFVARRKGGVTFEASRLEAA